MWFNSTQREEPYQDLTSLDYLVMEGLELRFDKVTGGAWLSSARVVRCWVKSRNERNPYGQLLHLVEHSSRTAVDKTEEGGDDVKSSCPLHFGLHTYYNGENKGKRNREVEQIS